MSKLSVKKPLTVLVAVIIVIVLGGVSYTKMTPDLLPSIDLPYVIVMTTYPGAEPEKVENTITKPMEQSMATLENIVNISSTSKENYSMIQLEFAEDVNMDTVTVDILQNISQIEGSWEDTVGTPLILKINPSMMPVVVAAVEMDGKNTMELTSLLNEEVLNKLEGVSGVASVTTSGMLEEDIKVEISQTKVNEVNAKILDAINGKFVDAESELNSAKQEIQDGQNQVESGKSQMEAGTEQFAGQMADAESQIQGKQSELVDARQQLQEQLKTLNDQLTQIEETEVVLQEIQGQINQLETAEIQLTALQQTIQNESSLTPVQVMELEATLAAAGMTRADVPLRLAAVQSALAGIDSSLAALGMTRSDINMVLAETAAGKAQIKAGIVMMETTLGQLESGGIQINDALTELNKQKTKTTIDLSTGAAGLLITDSTLKNALSQIEAGEEELKQAKEEAVKGADVNNLITADMISNILTAQNFSMPAGTVSLDGTDYQVRVGDMITSLDEMQNLLLFDMGIEGVAPIYLKDVAEVLIADNSDAIYAKMNGNDGVMLSFTKQSNYSTAEVSDNISKKFEELEKEYDGIHFTNLMDQGDYIYMVMDSIIQNLLFGAVFAVLILFLFLRDLRPTAIILVSIPISVVFAFVLMYFSGVTLNMISMSGLAIAVGMLVDNSVVVIENIYRLKNNGASAAKAAVSGATQVAGAIISSTLTTVAVFLPIVFVEGLTRQLLTDFALTMGYSLLASLIVALTLVPAMSAGLLKNSKEKKHGLLDRMLRVYEKSLRWTLKHKSVVLIGAVVLLVASMGVTLAKGFIFMPEMDSTQVTITLEMPEESQLEDTRKVSDEAIERIQKIKGVKAIGAMLSSGQSMMSSMGGSGSETSVSMYALLDENTSRTSNEIATEIEKVCKDLDAEITTSGSSMDANMLSGSGISVNLYGNNLQELQKTAKEVAEKLEKIDGTVNVTDGMEDADPEIHFTVDKEKAMKEGLTVAQVYAEIAGALKKETGSTTITYNDKDYQVQVSSREEEVYTPDYIKNYVIQYEAKDGEKKEIPIGDITEITETKTLSSISRSEQKRYMTVSAEIKEGHNVSLVANEVDKIMSKIKLPTGITSDYGGENENIMEAMVELVKMLLMAVLLVYLIMVAQFQSLKSPFIIMFTIPLAFTGGFLGLLLTGNEMSVIGMLGFVMLVGIIVNNGIVLVDYINQLRQEGLNKKEAIVEAGITRMRPILMTSLTTILGLSVTAVSGGMGANMMQPIAIVCIGGLLYATLLTMYVIPAMYDLMNRKELKVIADKDLEIIQE